ncbi:MAG: exo-beta-N-acetylmuramidase NamZ family protein [Bacteroidia bacterium]
MRLLFSSIICFACLALIAQPYPDSRTLFEKDLKTGASQPNKYLPLIKDKRVAVIANTSSMIFSTHLVDTLISLKVNVKKIFCPEHGFRGVADAGEKVKTEVDPKTNLPIISLYGKHLKPTKEELADVDVLIYDLQDVGVRFYTYISTMTHCMEAAAENGKLFMVLDRPNPNGYFVDGPVLEPAFKSFLGLHPVPLVYGMTCGEYAQMINNEGWLEGKVKCQLKVITIQGYNHADLYQLPVKPSPNLPNMRAVYLYPSLGLFEGTIVSVGRGTDNPFQVIGHPDMKGEYAFVPRPMEGAKTPKYMGKSCFGHFLGDFAESYVRDSKQLYLLWLTGSYKQLSKKGNFFDENFNFHAGNATLQQQIKAGLSEEKISQSWQEGIAKFKKTRKKYLLYQDFE